MADYNDVKNINQRRIVAGVALEQQNIERIQNTRGYAEGGGYTSWDEAKEFIFKLRTELIDYITAHGLVDGLVWDGQLQPVADRKIVITRAMIQYVTDTFGYLRDADAVLIINQILTDGHYVQDEHYVHTDNNLTDDLLSKLEDLPDDAEGNKVNDVIFNGNSVVVDKIATITITPGDIKTWYESNPDTNALTDALLAIINSVPGFIEATNDKFDDIDASLTELDEKIDSVADAAREYTDDTAATIRAEYKAADAVLDKKIDDTSKAITDRIDTLEIDVEKQLHELETKVDYNKGIDDQRFTETTTRLNAHDTKFETFDNRIQTVEEGQVTSVEKKPVKDGTEYILKTADGHAIEVHIEVPDSALPEDFNCVVDMETTSLELISGRIQYTTEFKYFDGTTKKVVYYDDSALYDKIVASQPHYASNSDSVNAHLSDNVYEQETLWEVTYDTLGITGNPVLLSVDIIVDSEDWASTSSEITSWTVDEAKRVFLIRYRTLRRQAVGWWGDVDEITPKVNRRIFVTYNYA